MRLPHAIRSPALLVLLVGVVAAPVTFAQSQHPWILTTGDFNTEAVALKAVTDAGLVVAGEDSKERTLGPDDFLQVERSAPAAVAAPQGKFVLHMTGGDRLGGEPVSITGDDLVWAAPGLGEVPVPMSRLVALTRPNQNAPDARGLEDVIVLSNGDAVRGIINSVADGKVMIKAGGGDEALPVPMDTIVSVQFAQTGGAKAAAKGYRVRLDDGSSVVAEGIELAGEQLKLRLAGKGEPRPIDFARVFAIEQVSGPAVFLSALDPTESVYVPFFGDDQDYPARMNQTVDGNRDLRFGGRQFRRGIGVHSYSKLSWTLDGKSYAAFRTQYGIEEDRTRADVTVRITLDDGRVVHERKNVGAGFLSPVVVVDLAGAKKITLEVDYGEGLHVDDHLTWLSPALLKNKPAK